MKTVRRTLFLVVVSGLLATCGSAWALESMISYWRFDEGSGTTAYDSVGGNDGTVYGPARTTGMVDGALCFDGVNDYVGKDTGKLDFAPSSFTISAWIKPREVTGGWRTILEYDRYDGGGPATSWFGIWLTRNGNFHFRIGHPTTINSLTILEPNNWYLLTATYNATNNQATLYINGAYDNSAILSPAHYWNAPAHSTISVGRRITGGEYFNGTIDEVAVWNRTLGPSEIQQHYWNGLAGWGYPTDLEIMAIRKIEYAIAEKLKVLERIDAALEKEWAAIEALEELLARDDCDDLNKANILAANQKIHCAIQQQKLWKKLLHITIQGLQDALLLLGCDVQS